MGLMREERLVQSLTPDPVCDPYRRETIECLSGSGPPEDGRNELSDGIPTVWKYDAQKHEKLKQG